MPMIVCTVLWIVMCSVLPSSSWSLSATVSVKSSSRSSTTSTSSSLTVSYRSETQSYSVLPTVSPSTSVSKERSHSLRSVTSSYVLSMSDNVSSRSESFSRQDTDSMSPSINTTSLTESSTPKWSTSFSSSGNTTTPSFSESSKPTQSPTATSNESSSLSESGIPTLTKSYSETAQTISLAMSMTKSVSRSRSKLLDLVLKSRISWIHRPWSYAVSGVPFSVQPVVAVDTTFNAHYPPRSCFVTSLTAGVRLMGTTVVPIIHSLCIFTDVGVLTGPSGVPIKIVVSLNTTLSKFPRLVMSSNVTTVVLANCPALNATVGASTVYSLLPPRADWLGVASVWSAIVSGYYFPFESRQRTFCNLNVSMRGNGSIPQYGILRARASFLDMCHLRCIISQSTVDNPTLFAHVMQQGPLRANFYLTTNEVKVDSVCHGTDPSFLTGHHSVCQANSDYATEMPVGGCNVHFVSPLPHSVVFNPPSGSISTSFSSSSMRFSISQLSVVLCDASNNTVLLPPAFALSAVPLLPPASASVCVPLTIQQPSLSMSSSTVMSYGILCNNITSPVNMTATLCGDGHTSQPVVFNLTMFDGSKHSNDGPTASWIPYCVTDDHFNESFVVSMAIINEESILATADDAATLPVPLQLEFYNWLQDVILLPLNLLDPELAMYPLEVRYLWADDKTGAVSVIDTTLVNVSLHQVPVTLDSVQMPLPGRGYGIELAGLRDAMPRVRLWGSDYPTRKNITVHNCSSLAGTFQIQDVIFHDVNATSCGKFVPSLGLSNRVPLQSVSKVDSFVVTVLGWRFDYAMSIRTTCHYSTLTDVWSPQSTPGTVTQWVSSCMVLCAIPRQSFPIRQASTLYVDPADGAVKSRFNNNGNYSKTAFSSLGLLRIKYGLLNSWSNPLALDVVGSPKTLFSDSWDPLNYAFQRKDVTRLPTLLVQVVDVLGAPLGMMDPALRSVNLFASNTSAADLNASRVVNVFVSTCQPDAGASTFDLVFETPATGTYSLSIASANLSSISLPLYLTPYDNVTSFQLAILVPPYSFNTQTLENPLGTLPVQPVVMAVHPDTGQLDASISDISCIATIVPWNASTTLTNGVKLDSTVCNPAFGNCAVFQNGMANFSKLSFVGVPGAKYSLIIQPRNESVVHDATPLRFNITTANCSYLPADLHTSTAVLVGPFNASLTAPLDGFLIRGWKFDPAVGVTCYFNGTEFPAVIIDYCTVRCLALSSATVGAPPSASPMTNCYVNSTIQRIQCREASGGALFVCSGSCNGNVSMMTQVANGNITFVGAGRSIQAIANVASPRSLPDGSQVVIAATEVRLDALLVAVVDGRGQFVDDVDTTSNGVTVVLSRNISSVPNELKVPFAYLGSYNNVDNSTCYETDEMIPPMQFSSNSTLTCVVSNGLCVFDQLYLEYPRTGQYLLSASTPSLSGQAWFTLHVIAGKPMTLCILTNLSGTDSWVQHNYLLLHAPKLLTLDVAGNIYQSATLDPKLAALPFAISSQAPQPGPSSSIRARLYRKRDEEGTFSLMPDPVPETALIQSDYSIEFASLTVQATYGATFRIEFFVSGNDTIPLTSVTSPPLKLLECANAQFAMWGASTCETCYSGSAWCDGVETTCFTCNGSMHINVTQGYWRYSPQAYHAYQCPLGSCIGDTELGTCAEGYLERSPLCTVCDTGYAADFMGSCVRCSGVVLTSILFALAVIMAIIVVAIIVFVTVTEQEDDDNSLVLLLKICVNFVQTSGTIGQFSMNMPHTVKQFLGVQNSISGGSGISISPFNCLAPSFTFIDKYRVQMAGPPLALLFMALLVKAVTVRLRSDFRNLFNLVIMVFMFLIYQTLVEQSVIAMYCVPILGPSDTLVLSVLKQDMRVSCLGTQHQLDVALAVYSLAVYGLGIPVLALVLIMLTSASEGWEVAYVRYSFLISGYRLRYWYWEMMILTRKICLLLLVTSTDNVTLQALLAIWMLTACLVLTIRCQPFVKGVLNQAESLALMVQLVTVNVGLFFRTVSSSATCGPLCIVVSSILLVANAAVFIYFGRHLALEGYLRILSAFGLDLVHGSDNQRVISIRNIKKTILSQLRYQSATDFINFKPRATSSEVSVESNQDTIAMAGEDEEEVDDHIELLTLRPIGKTIEGLRSRRRSVGNGQRHASIVVPRSQLPTAATAAAAVAGT